MFKNSKINFKKKFIVISIAFTLGSIGLIINKEIYLLGNKRIEFFSDKTQSLKGFEDIESVKIDRVYVESGESKIKNISIIEETEKLENIISFFNKKIPLPNERYCALYDNKFTVNKKDGTSEEYTVLLGNKYILINDGEMNHRIEDEDIVLEFKKFF